tara:strand:+ start:4300 stop:4737 length:438 start_codon:yes stop_codon:yes gene_type:complete
MANIKIVQTSNFGRSLGNSLSDVTFSLYDTAGSLYSSGSYSNIAVYEMPSSSGIYGTELTVNTLFSGSIVWKHNAGGTPVYASEEVKIDQKMARYIHTGDWVIDEEEKQMIFYADDGTTEIARYDLKDRNSDASIAEVFKRILVR